ncbi:MAG: type VI secretion system accessory protein TagJ [Aliidongia sp.]
MSTPQALFETGRLDEAIAAANEGLKSRPADVDLRSFLVELLCFDGQIERADKQLESISRLQPQYSPGVKQFRDLLRGEQARRDVLFSGRAPELMLALDPCLEAHLMALVLLREGRPADALTMLRVADEQRPPVGGSSDGVRFEDLRDLDDVLSPVVEMITADGKFYWVPISGVKSIEFEPPDRARDLIWRSARLELADGKHGHVYIPALYVTPPGADPALRLGRATDWIEQDGGPVRGIGRKCWLVGEEDQDIMALTRIEIDQPEIEAVPEAEDEP